MSTIKTSIIIFLSIVMFSCNSDDDSSSGSEANIRELLTSGTWYLESKMPDDFSDCERNSSFKFNADGSLNSESFDDDSGTCESEGQFDAAYTLNGNNLTITFGPELIEATINSISETAMNITDDEGDTIVFDKTQG